jgi:hypothetical protein
MSYATVDQLAGKLTISGAKLTAKTDDLQRVLDAATLEIDTEIAGPLISPSDEQIALLASVCLARAQDLWLVEGLPIGVVGLGGETPLMSPRDSWQRHANVLAVLKQSWGLA